MNKNPMGLPPRLKTLVGEAVAVLGMVLKRELGDEKFILIESIRQRMMDLREEENPDKAFFSLNQAYDELKGLEPQAQIEMGRAFTLMLEVINTCENAYRSFRLNQGKAQAPSEAQPKILPEALVYVLTAHPTEARSPENIQIFHEVQKILQENLRSNQPLQPKLLHHLEIAWLTQIMRTQSPEVKDEAEHVYSMLFRREIISKILSPSARKAPFYIRSWVGGDKDGHPGVDEKTLVQSLTLSRRHCLHVLEGSLKEIQKSLDLILDKTLSEKLITVRISLRKLQVLKSNDGKAIVKLRKDLAHIESLYLAKIGVPHSQFPLISALIHAFPALVVPMELRESSEVLETDQKKWPTLAIFKMLKVIEDISRGGRPRYYVQGFVISMTRSLEHLKLAVRMQEKVFGQALIPAIPLFEEAKSLAESDQTIQAFIDDAKLAKIAKDNWRNHIEMMVGYSDSSKESGVLASRLAISKALPKLEAVCLKSGFKPVFFHGSGGSIDRGGGTIEDQTAWWPKSALMNYKVTVQGEMIERSFSTAAIATRQIEKITEEAAKGLQGGKNLIESSVVDTFAAIVAKHYQAAIVSKSFLKVVEAATPYLYLRHLKIGSRPSKRSTELTVMNLRAIPWVLCWTQTRVLFQTWWGVGSAWEQCTDFQKQELKAAFNSSPVFTSYMKALGFTLAKVQLGIFKLYLQESQLDEEEKANFIDMFTKEFELCKKAYLEICDKKDLMWYRPWLGESISLRSPMIHPLNMLQIIAMQKQDPQLLRLSVTGIASGMLTTG
jgi:phosphoenolpyruvate carboxylase